MSNYSDKKVDLVINKVTKEQYDKITLSGLIKQDEVYFVTNDNLNAEGKTVQNVADPQISSDAANKLYVDENISQKSKVCIVTWED